MFTAVTETNHERPHTASFSTSGAFIFEYNRSFLAYSNDPLDEGGLARLALLNFHGIQIGSYYQTQNYSDTGSLCTEINPTPYQRDEHRAVWQINVHYTSDLGQQGTPPQDEPPDVQWGTNRFTRSAVRDKNGQLILNFAKRPFTDPPIEIDDSRTTLVYSRNELSFNQAVPGAYRDKVNSATFLGYGTRQVKCTGIGATLVQTGIIAYYRVTYEFEFDPETWDREYLQADTIDIAGNRIIRKGVPDGLPCPLGPDGRMLVAGANPHYLKPKIYKEANFNDFNIS